jgi:hypothetical protein
LKFDVRGMGKGGSTREWLGTVRTDAKIIRFPDRYTDKRGDEIWARVIELLDRRRQRQEAVRSERKA